MLATRLTVGSRHRAQPVRVKVFGVGSAGCSMVDSLPFLRVAVSSSPSDLERSGAERKVAVGQATLSAAGDVAPSVIRHAHSVVPHELYDIFNNTDLAFLMTGLGGFTGSKGSVLLSSIAQAKSVPTVALVAMPFSAESARRRESADMALERLMRSSDVCIRFDNDELSSLAPHMPISRAFSLLNGIMQRPVIDLCAVMSREEFPILVEAAKGSDAGRFGLGLSRGDERVQKVVAEALSSPWFSRPLSEASSAMAVYSSADPWDKELENLMDAAEPMLPGAKTLWGSYADPGLGERIRLSVVVFWPPGRGV
jgi:cell division protein FtsZ